MAAGGGGGACAWAAVLRIINPIGFNAFRLISLSEWLAAAAAAATAALAPSALAASPAEAAFCAWGLVLAALNLGLWVYNLFGFLLLQALPLYFDPARFAR